MKSLKKITFDLSQETIELQKSSGLFSSDLDVVQEKYTLLRKGKYDLQCTFADLQKIVLKFSEGEENLYKILGSQKASSNKEGISFELFNHKKCYKSSLLNRSIPKVVVLLFAINVQT